MLDNSVPPKGAQDIELDEIKYLVKLNFDEAKVVHKVPRQELGRLSIRMLYSKLMLTWYFSEDGDDSKPEVSDVIALQIYF